MVSRQRAAWAECAWRIGADENGVEAACVYTARSEHIPAASVVLVTCQVRSAGIRKLVRIGDCLAPGTIAAAIYAGHRLACEHGQVPADGVDFKRENVALAPNASLR